MKLLLDQGVPLRAVALLRAAGIDALHASDAGLSAAADADIVEISREAGWTIVTLDADFHALVALSGRNAPSTIRIRVEGLKGPETARLLASVVESCGADLEAGALVTVDENGIRVRRLPIVGGGGAR